MAKEKDVSEQSLRVRLTPEQFHVTQEQGTERAFTGEYHDCKLNGTYQCICCGVDLFSSDTKFDSGSGWPSFWEAVSEGNVKIRADTKFGMVREEVICANCGAHLGHVFPDGPQPTGQRFCINSASLNLEQDPD